MNTLSVADQFEVFTFGSTAGQQTRVPSQRGGNTAPVGKFKMDGILADTYTKGTRSNRRVKEWSQSSHAKMSRVATGYGNQVLDVQQFTGTETRGRSKSDWLQPELGFGRVARCQREAVRNHPLNRKSTDKDPGAEPSAQWDGGWKQG